jgi:hypothetical protein
LTPARVEQTLSQYQAQPIPENHPVLPQLSKMFGEHTFFLDQNGLSIVEPVEPNRADVQEASVVKLARWSDESRTNLSPHEPEPTDTVIMLAADEGR